MATQTSPAVLKERVGVSRTYIRPLQQDLNLDPVKDKSDRVSYVGFHPHFSSQSKNNKYAYNYIGDVNANDQTCDWFIVAKREVFDMWK